MCWSCDVRIVAAHLRDYVPPELRHFEDVCLVDGEELLAPRPGKIEAHFRDPPDLRLGIDHGVDPDPLAVLDPDAAGLAEIGVAQEFTDDHEIDPPDDLRLERRGVDQILEDDDRPEVGVEAEPRAEAEEAPLRPEAVVERFPFRAAHGAQEYGVARHGHLQDILGQRGAEPVVGRPADQPLLHLEPDAGACGHDVEDLPRLPHDLRPDPVAGEDRYAIFLHFALRFFAM